MFTDTITKLSVVCTVVVNPDFWKVAARKISAVLSSDLDAMKDYLDSVREVDVPYSRFNG